MNVIIVINNNKRWIYYKKIQKHKMYVPCILKLMHSWLYNLDLVFMLHQ